MVFTETIELKDEVSPAAKSAADEVGGLASQTGGLQAELAEVTGGLSLVAEALAVVGGAFGAAAIAGSAFAISSSQAKEQMLSMFDALGGAAMSGKEVDDMLDGLRDKLGVTKDAMTPLVKSFMSMGVEGKEALEMMTTAALSAKALAGGADSGAAAFTNLMKKIQLAAATGQQLKIPLKGLGSLAEMGLKVDDVAKHMNMSTEALASQLKSGSVDATKFGDALSEALIEKGAGPLQKMSMGIGNLWSLLKENVGDMFEDMQQPVGGFVAALKDMFSIFGQAKPSGQAMKAGVQGVFTNLLQTATKIVPIVKHFLLNMVIYGLKAYIAIKSIVKTMQEFSKTHDIMGKLTKAWEFLKPALIVIGVVLAVIVGLFVVAALMILGAQLAIAAFAVAIVAFVTGAGIALMNWVGGAASAAADFIMGLVDGIKSGAGSVVDAVKGLASGAKNAFKNALGISSPSKVMMQMGGFFGEGAAQGIEGSENSVVAASGGLAGAAASGFSSGGGSGGGSGGSGVTVTVEAGAIVINGAGKAAEQITEEMISLLFERIALAQGAR